MGKPETLPRCMTREDAAAYCRLTKSGFQSRVTRGLLPGPIPGTHRWDKLAIDRAGAKRAAFLATLPDSHKKPGTVYVVQFGKHVKIGWSSQPDVRIGQIDNGLPEACECLARFPGTVADEHELHRRFNHLRSRGEWFRLNREMRKWITEGCPL